MPQPPYQPAQGSTAARAIAHLATLPDGTWLRTRDLADAIGAPASGMMPNLQRAIDHGALQSRQAQGSRFLEWALPAALDAFEADERRGGRPVQRTVPAAAASPAGKPGPASVFELSGAPPTAANGLGWKQPKARAKAKTPGRPPRKPRKPRQAATPQALALVAPASPAPPPADPSVVCAVFNTGELLIEARGQQPLRLAREQTRELLAWLRSFQPVEKPEKVQ